MNVNVNSIDENDRSIVQRENSLSPLDLLDNLFYFRWFFILAFVVVVGISLAYAIMTTPIYTADALIQVEEKKGTSLGALTQVANALGAQQSPVLGEIEIIRSRNVIGKAVESLHGNIEINIDNRIPVVGGWLARMLQRNSDGLAIPLFDSSRWAWGGENVKFREFVVGPDYIGKILYLSIGDAGKWELSTKDGTILLKGIGNEDQRTPDEQFRIQIESIKARPGTKFRIVYFSLQSRIRQVLNNLTVAETTRQSGILRLTYQSSSAAFAASMLNAIGDAYISQNLSRRSEEAELSLKFLNSELPKLRTRLDASEKALNEFRSKTKTIDISSEIKELLTKSTVVEKTQLELELKRREFAERYDTNHPMMKSLNSQLSEVKAESIKISSQISHLPLVQQDFIRLARDVEVNNQLYIGLLNNSQQLQIAKAGTVGNVSIVDRAVAPEQASKPKKALIVSLGGLVGILLGFGVCQLLGFITKIVRDPKKLEIATGLPTLAILPLDFDQTERVEKQGHEEFLLAKERPDSPSVEALRSLRTSLLFKLSEKARGKVVLITSAVPAQGKSFIVANLSYILSVTGKKVLLIEADIRLASIKRYLSFDTSRPGLSSVLKDGFPLMDAIIKDVHPNLDFLPSGQVVRNPGDLLSSASISVILKELADKYDLVLIDSPPLLPVHDARSLGNSADVSLFVARQNSVNIAEVRDAIDVFQKAGNQFDGTVFNGFVPSRLRYGYGYGYGFGYGYGRYGTYGLLGRRGQRYGGKYGAYGGR